MIDYIVFGTIGVGVLILVALITSFPREPDNLRHEKSFLGDKNPLPSFTDAAELDLTVVIPAYNEQDRLPAMLEECVECLSTSKKQTYEIIVVDDGSKDGTSNVVEKLSKKNKHVKCLKLMQNRGKGHAVKMGMMCARGSKIFFADADRAMPFTEFQKINKVMADSVGEQHELIVVGSRAHLEKDSIAQRSLFRTILMKGFHLLVQIFCVRTVKDTQCGYKLFTRSAAQRILPQLHLQRWAFDVELLFIAERLSIPLKEVAIKWDEIDGSKMTPVFSWIEMGRDLVLIWLRYAIGYWRIDLST
ncbi:unnamed protein product [Oikopleura dioica]|uniref:dolichyl-phosphate beta-glucosyltransferase n=1 Tax=Oikopleura dioica TaxID=34765 RepID=E4XBI8_OIKDI|nr:unnamed protein product [Oikopleura dioica]CBY34402.1 unnamed protein product [Oikopleura dioica]